MNEGADEDHPEAIVGGVLGPLNAPEALLLGRHDERGRLRMAGRTAR